MFGNWARAAVVLVSMLNKLRGASGASPTGQQGIAQRIEF
jgi:hypothetical protein